MSLSPFDFNDIHSLLYIVQSPIQLTVVIAVRAAVIAATITFRISSIVLFLFIVLLLRLALRLRFSDALAPRRVVKRGGRVVRRGYR